MSIIVIGAGITGASTAYHLAMQGAEVTLVDAAHEGQATAAGAGIICPWLSASAVSAEWLSLAEQGVAYYPDLIGQLAADGEQDTSYKRVGALFVAAENERLDQIERQLIWERENSPLIGEIKRLTATEAKTAFPPLQIGMGAIYISGAARVDGNLLCSAMKWAAMKRGASTLEGLAELQIEDGQLQGVKLGEKLLRADQVVIAGGAWSRELSEQVGVQLRMEPQRGQIAHLTLSGQDTSQWPVVLPDNDYYLVSFDNSRVVAGATRENGSGFDYRKTAGGVKEVLDEALAVAPALADGTLHEVRVGFRPASHDRLPLLGKVVNGLPVIIATGMGPTGLTVGPYAGKIAAQLALGESVDVDITPFNPAR